MIQAEPRSLTHWASDLQPDRKELGTDALPVITLHGLAIRTRRCCWRCGRTRRWSRNVSGTRRSPRRWTSTPMSHRRCSGRRWTASPLAAVVSSVATHSSHRLSRRRRVWLAGILQRGHSQVSGVGGHSRLGRRHAHWERDDDVGVVQQVRRTSRRRARGLRIPGSQNYLIRNTVALCAARLADVENSDAAAIRTVSAPGGPGDVLQ